MPKIRRRVGFKIFKHERKQKIFMHCCVDISQ